MGCAPQSMPSDFAAVGLLPDAPQAAYSDHDRRYPGNRPANTREAPLPVTSSRRYPARPPGSRERRRKRRSRQWWLGRWFGGLLAAFTIIGGVAAVPQASDFVDSALSAVGSLISGPLASGPTCRQTIRTGRVVGFNRYANSVLGEHPAALYEFDDAPGSRSFVDASGNRNTATSDGSDRIVPQGPPGSPPRALEIGDDGAVTPALCATSGDHPRTFEVWFKTTRSGDQCLASSGVAQHARAFSLCLTDGKQGGAPPPRSPGVYLQTVDADVYIPNPQLADDQWHYLAVALSRSTVLVDVDGRTPPGFIWNGASYSVIARQPFLLPSTPDTATTGTGIGTAGWGSIFKGWIADAALYPAALPLRQLVQHFVAGMGAHAE